MAFLNFHPYLIINIGGMATIATKSAAEIKQKVLLLNIQMLTDILLVTRDMPFQIKT